MDTDELLEEIKQILEAVGESKMSGIEAVHTIFVLTNPHNESEINLELKGTEKVILLRDGTLVTGMTNEIAQKYKDRDFLYMGDLKGIAERFNDECPVCPNCNLPMVLMHEDFKERTFSCEPCDIRDKFCKKCKLEQSICTCQ